MNYLANMLARSGLLKRDLDYHLLRAAMVIIFAWFGYDKWFEAEIRGLLPIITHGPFIFWTIPVLGIRGTAIFLGASEWTFGTLLLLGFWNKKAGMLGALGSTFTFIATFTVLPFVPDAWDAGAGGFPAMVSRTYSAMSSMSDWRSARTASGLRRRARTTSSIVVSG